MAERGLEYLQGESKRRLDFYGGIAIAGALLPVAAATAAALFADHRSRQLIFRQERVGYAGKPLQVFKFRTIAQHLTRDAVQTFGTFDPRASKIGSFIRQAGLDEAPQLINVINGDMSLVGIRPLLTVDINRFQDADPILFNDWHAYYLASRPALTGPGQLYRHHFRESATAAIYRESMTRELMYCENASLKGDVKVLLHTPVEMITANLSIIEPEATEIDSRLAA